MLNQNLKAVDYILPYGICLAETSQEIQEVINFRTKYCQDGRPGVKEFQNDGLDMHSYVLYGQDPSGQITSTARLLLDSEHGFPEESLLPQSVCNMRLQNLKLAELGRLVITEDTGKLLGGYYKAIYDISQIEGVDLVLIVMKKRNFSSHKKIMSVEILSNDMGCSWDEEQAELCLVAWDIKAEQPKFHKWVNRDSVKFQKEQWNEYSKYHLGVLVSVQHEVYNHVSSMLHGRVLDAGCGSARVMGYIQDNQSVSNYTGVDSSGDMIKQASWLKKKLGYQNAEFICSKIEDIGGKYDSIFSIHSFYAWPDPERTLRKINSLLKKMEHLY